MPPANGSFARRPRAPRKVADKAKKWLPKTAIAHNAPDHKLHVEEAIAALKAEADAHVGKEWHSLRAAKGKAIQELRRSPMYVDACRVVKGLNPLHGHFTVGYEAAKPEVNEAEAATLAAEADRLLRELEPPRPEHPDPDSADEESLVSDWSARLAKLEAKMAWPAGHEEVDELEAVAQDVLSYRLKLKSDCGYRERDLKADARLNSLEDRLDVLAGAFLPAEAGERATAGVEELREWERKLAAKLARYTKDTAGLNPAAAKEVEQLLREITELKAFLRSEGLTEHEQDKDERVLMKRIRLAELQQFRHRDKKQEKRERREVGAILEEVGRLEASIEGHKQKLREERGLTHAGLKQNAALSELEGRLAVLQAMGRRFGGA